MTAVNRAEQACIALSAANTCTTLPLVEHRSHLCLPLFRSCTLRRKSAAAWPACTPSSCTGEQPHATGVRGAGWQQCRSVEHLLLFKIHDLKLNRASLPSSCAGTSSLVRWLRCRHQAQRARLTMRQAAMQCSPAWHRHLHATQAQRCPAQAATHRRKYAPLLLLTPS